MPVKGSPLLLFCICALDGRIKKYVNFYWTDREKGRFVLVCLNKRNKRWTREHFEIFQDYVKSCKRKSNEKIDPRQRFISALEKSTFLVKIPSTDRSRREYEIKPEYLSEYLSRARINSVFENYLFDYNDDSSLDGESFFDSGYETSPSSGVGIYSPSSFSVGSPSSLFDGCSASPSSEASQYSPASVSVDTPPSSSAGCETSPFSEERQYSPPSSSVGSPSSLFDGCVTSPSSVASQYSPPSSSVRSLPSSSATDDVSVEEFLKSAEKVLKDPKTLLDSSAWSQLDPNLFPCSVKEVNVTSTLLANYQFGIDSFQDKSKDYQEEPSASNNQNIEDVVSTEPLKDTEVQQVDMTEHATPVTGLILVSVAGNIIVIASQQPPLPPPPRI